MYAALRLVSFIRISLSITTLFHYTFPEYTLIHAQVSMDMAYAASYLTMSIISPAPTPDVEFLFAACCVTLVSPLRFSERRTHSTIYSRIWTNSGAAKRKEALLNNFLVLLYDREVK